MRSCSWEPEFQEQLAALEPNAKRADELIFGIDWVISRNPREGSQIEETDVWYLISRDIPKRRHLIIYYTFTEEKVYFISVMESPLNTERN